MENDKEKYLKVPTKEPIKDGISEKPTSYGYGCRHIQAALLLLNLTMAYTTRAHMSLTVVAMSKHTNTSVVDINKTNIFSSVSINVNATDDEISDYNYTDIIKDEINETDAIVTQEKETVTSAWDVYKTYEWPKSIQELILDSFFLGYFLMMFPMGIICQRFGGKIALQVCLLVNGIVTIATPTVAAWGGWKAVCFCRVLQGLSQAGVYPSTHTVLSKWVPICERAKFSSYIYTGSTVGTVIAFQAAGALASSKAGWPATFWVLGAVCLGAFLLITLLVASTPTEHKTVSEEEKKYILGKTDDGVKKNMKIPWKQILTSKHVWGAFVCHVATGVTFVFLFTQIPSYMYYILGFNIKDSGTLSSLPYVANIFCSVGFGYASEYCTNKSIFSLRLARIICNSVAQVGPALCLVAVSFTENSTMSVILLVFGVALISGVHTGWMVNYIDLSPNFSGSLMAFGNTMTSFGSLGQPILISYIVTDVRNRSQWRIMMSLMAIIIFIANAVFCWFASADKQPWDQIDTKDTRDPEEMEELKH